MVVALSIDGQPPTRFAGARSGDLALMAAEDLASASERAWKRSAPTWLQS
jgi:hypothetical protein